MDDLSEGVSSEINTALNIVWTAQLTQQQNMEEQIRACEAMMAQKFDVLSKRIIELESEQETRNEYSVDDDTVQMIHDGLHRQTGQVGQLYDNSVYIHDYSVYIHDYSQHPRREIDLLKETIASQDDEIASLKEHIATKIQTTQDLSAKLNAVNEQITMAKEDYREIIASNAERQDRVVKGTAALEKKVNANMTKVNRIAPKTSATDVPDVALLGDKVAACHTDITAIKIAIESLSSKHAETDRMVKIHHGEVDDMLRLIDDNSHDVGYLKHLNKNKYNAIPEVEDAIKEGSQNAKSVLELYHNLIGKFADQELKLAGIQEEFQSQNTQIDQRMSVHENRLETLIKSVDSLGDIVGDLYDKTSDHSNPIDEGSVDELESQKSAGSCHSSRTDESYGSIQSPEEERSLDNSEEMPVETPVVEDTGFKRVKAQVKNFFMSKIRGRDKRELIEYHSEEYYAKCEELELFKQQMWEIVRTGQGGRRAK